MLHAGISQVRTDLRDNFTENRGLMMKKVKQTIAVALSVSALLVNGAVMIPAVSAAEVAGIGTSEEPFNETAGSVNNSSSSTGENAGSDSTETLVSGERDEADSQPGAQEELSSPAPAGEPSETSSEETVSVSETAEDTAMVMSSVDTAPANPATPTPTPGPVHQAVPTPLIFADSETYESKTEGDSYYDPNAGTSDISGSPAAGTSDISGYPAAGASGIYGGDSAADYSDGSGMTAAVKTGSDSTSGKTRAVKTGAVKTADTDRFFPEAAALGLSSVCLAVLIRRRKHNRQTLEH